MADPGEATFWRMEAERHADQPRASPSRPRPTTLRCPSAWRPPDRPHLSLRCPVPVRARTLDRLRAEVEHWRDNRAKVADDLEAEGKDGAVYARGLAAELSSVLGLMTRMEQS